MELIDIRNFFMILCIFFSILTLLWITCILNQNVYNEQGETVDSSRLGQLKNTIDETNIQHGIITDKVKKAKIKSSLPPVQDISEDYKPPPPSTKLTKSDKEKKKVKEKVPKLLSWFLQAFSF